MSKGDAINIMNDSNLVNERGFIKILLLHIKTSKITDLTYYQKNREVILNRDKDHYENDKERLRE